MNNFKEVDEMMENLISLSESLKNNQVEILKQDGGITKIKKSRDLIASQTQQNRGLVNWIGQQQIYKVNPKRKTRQKVEKVI